MRVLGEVRVRKSVKVGRTVYDVSVTGDSVIAGSTTYPMPGYGNNYGTVYKIVLNYSRRWALLVRECFNNGYATRGHGMSEAWIDFENYMKVEEARSFAEALREKLLEAEDSTPDVKEVFDDVVKLFESFEA